MAPVITVAGLKGGTGKTSTAVALASYWGFEGQRVLLVDADVNGSALRWHRRGEGALPFEITPITQAPMAMQRPWDWIITDTAGGSRDEIKSFAEGSTFVVCPCQPAASSLEQLLDLIGLIGDTAHYSTLITMVDSRRRGDANKAQELLRKEGYAVLDSKVALLSCWPKSEAQGTAVRDARSDTGRPDAGAPRAWEEVINLAVEVEHRINLSATAAA